MKTDKETVKMTFEVVEPLDVMVDKETLKKEFGGGIHKLAKFLFREEGVWWGNEMKLIKTEIIKKK